MASHPRSFESSTVRLRGPRILRDMMLHCVSGKLYAVGGSDGSHSLCSTEIYCPQEKIWTPGPNMTTARANVGVAVIGSRLYAVGGFSGMVTSLV